MPTSERSRLSRGHTSWVRGLASKMPFYRFMGIRLVGVGWGRSEIRLKVGRGLTQNAGFAHGGVSAALIDSAVGLALCTMIDSKSSIRTIDLHVNFLAPARPGSLTARGRIIHRGKRTAVGDCEFTDEARKLVSKGTATYLILEDGKENSIYRPVQI